MRLTRSYLVGLSTVVLPEPEAGVTYEVRARATVDGIVAFIGTPQVFYGEYSETATVPVP